MNRRRLDHDSYNPGARSKGKLARFCPDGIQPCVAVGMIEMPVRDGIGAKTGKSSGDLRTRYVNTGIDKNFAVRAGQDGDVSAGALEYADIVSQHVRNDGRYRGAVLDLADDAARL